MPSVWNGPNNGFWDDAANWTGGTPDAVGAEAEFSLVSQANPLTVQLRSSEPITIGRIDINNAALGVTFTAFDSPSTFIFDHVSGTTPSVNNNSTGDLTFAAGAGLTLQMTEATIFNTSSSGAINIGAAITGTRLIKTGNGTLNLTGTNTFGDGMAIQGGRVAAQGDSSLGSDTITLSNGAELRLLSSDTVNNAISVFVGGSPAEESGVISAANGTTLTLTGALRHFGSGTLTLGSAGSTATIIADLSFIGHNSVSSSMAIAGGTLRIGNSMTSGQLLNFGGTGLTTIASGAVLDTNGFATIISNLDLNGGTVRTSSGTLSLVVNDRSGMVNAQNGTFEGTAGSDSVVFDVGGLSSNGDFDLSAATFANWTAGVDTITIRSDGNSTIIGSSFNDLIQARGGLDSIFGGLGNDEIVVLGFNTGSSADGGGGFDTLTVDGGGNLVMGPVSNMEAIKLLLDSKLEMTSSHFTNGFALNTQISGIGKVIINMNSGSLLIKPMTILAGSSVTFTINGSAGVDVIKAVAGAASTINTGEGTNTVQGGDLVDTIVGGSGIDKIAGNGGADVMSGGGGADVFKFRKASDSGTGASADVITDFLAGTDRLNFSRIDADPNTPGDQAFTYIGTSAFANNGTAQIRWVDLGADLRVEVDVDGNGTADMHILLQGAGAQTLTAADFVL